jgi:hypothetical protein
MARRTQTPPREPREPARLTAMLARDTGTVKGPMDQPLPARGASAPPAGARRLGTALLAIHPECPAQIVQLPIDRVLSSATAN